MSNIPFDLICMCDSRWGIARNGQLPGFGTDAQREDMQWFRTITIGGVLIMGRKTYTRPLPGRATIVLSRSYAGVMTVGIDTDRPVIYVNDFDAALECARKYFPKRRIWCCGGAEVYRVALQHNSLRCAYVTIQPVDCGCDVRFPSEFLPPHSSSWHGRHNQYLRYEFNLEPALRPEWRYLDLLCELLMAPRRENRTGIHTLGVAHRTLSFDLAPATIEHTRGPTQSISPVQEPTAVWPLLTTKRINHHAVVVELLWFLRGEQNTSYLDAHGVDIWRGNTTREYHQRTGHGDYVEGDTGPIYGYQWRHWGAWKGTECVNNTNGATNGHTPGVDRSTSATIGHDQIQDVINTIRNDPNSRRMVVSAWNVADLGAMCLPPCHYSFQVRREGDDIDLLVNMRSADVALGVPFNIASYALLAHILGAVTGTRARTLYLSMMDTHIYENHIEGIKRQVRRVPRTPPRLDMSAINHIDGLLPEAFAPIGYDPHPAIKLDMAV